MSTLESEGKDVETRWRAEVQANPEPPETRIDAGSPEDRELRRLIAGARVSDVVQRVLESRSVSGATAELQEHRGLADNQLPIELLAGRARPASEVRTNGQTSAPSDTQGNQQPITPALFPESQTAWLGCATPTVAVGESVFPVLTTSADVKTPGGGANAADSAAAFTASVLTPKRLQASVFFRLEDSAVFGGMEDALRMNLADALGSGLDKVVIDQFTAASGGLADPGNPGTVTNTLAGFVSELYGGVDGVHARSAMDLRWLVNSELYAKLGGLFDNNYRDNTVGFFTMRSGGLRTSPHMPATSGNIATVITCKAGAGFNQNMVAPIWQGVTLIRDEVSQSKAGEVRLTAVMLHNVAILRSAGYQRLEFKLA